MLLESALADLSTDDSRVYVSQPGSVPFEWEEMPGTPKSPLKSAKEFYQLDLRPPPSRQVSGEVSAWHPRQSSDLMWSPRSTLSDMKSPYQPSLKPPPSRQLSCDFKGSPSKLSSGQTDYAPEKSPRASSMSFRLDKSRSSPQLGVNLGSTSGSTTPTHRSLASGADENLLNDNMSFTGEAAAVPFVWELQPGKSKSPPPSFQMHLSPPRSGDSTPKHRALNSAADENLWHDNMSFTGEELAVPFTWEAQPGKPKFQKGKSIRELPQLQLPPARMLAIKEKDSKSASPRTMQNDRPASSVPAKKREVQQEQVKTGPPRRTASQPARFRLGDVIRIRKLESSKSSASMTMNRSRNVNDAFVSADSEFRYYEERSPVSTLDRLPSPPLNSSGSSGSPIHSPKTLSPTHREAPVYSAARPRLTSFSSTSAQSSPRFSTSSSARYMGHCLVALQQALATDPENSKRFEDSFVELDTFVETTGPRSFVKSPVHFGTRDNRVGDSDHSQLERVNSSADFRQDNGDEQSKPSSSNASLARTDSETSATSFICRPIKRSLKAPRLREDEYSVEDKRFLSDHPSLWVASQREDSLCTTSNSKCSTLARHEDVYWEDQQADGSLNRPNEVVRGAADGLRFTYSPVSSAFVFSRSNEEEPQERTDLQIVSHQRKNTSDTDNSQRFSISLDYGTSEVSHSLARSSNVTELDLSRAESWSKVARGIAYQQAQQGFQDAIPLNLIKRTGSIPQLPERQEDVPSVEFSRGFVDCTESRFIHKRSTKKSGLATCLPFLSILKHFKAIRGEHPTGSRLRHAATL